MSALNKNNELVAGKRRLIAVAIFGAALVVASIYSLFRILNKSVDETRDALTSPAAMAPASTNYLTPEDIERQHAMYKPPTPAIQEFVAAPAAVIPVNQTNAEIILQKEKTKFNQQIVERLKQYAKDNPTLDTRELERQIKKRESQGAPIQ